MLMYVYFPDVSSNYHFEYHTDFQDRELKRENVIFNDGLNDKYETNEHKNVRCDVNVKSNKY